MVTYSVAQVEALSGISAHSLRIWERRFDFVEPYRTDTNIRYYSDIQLKKLINVGILLRNSFKISKVVAMTDEDIHSQVSNILLQPSIANQEDINALTLCMIDMNEQKFNELYQSHILRQGLLSTFVHLIYPFLNHIGILWGLNKAMPAQEHFISNLIRQKLISATDSLPQPSAGSPSLLLFLLDGEDHEIGLLLANYIAKETGWRTFYLGQNVPSDNIKMVCEQIKADLMFSMFVSPRNSKFEKMLNTLLDHIRIPLLYSGNANLLDVSVFKDRTVLLESPDGLVDYLKKNKP